MLLTFGHGTASAERMTELLRGAGVAGLIDIRTAPGSRRHPHVARAELEHWLPEAGICYRWDKRLGGFRRPAPDSPDLAWREDMFRGYAGHMRTADFLAAVDEVLAQASRQVTTVMCAESLWWRCHRRLLADFVCAARGVPVRHLMPAWRSTASPPACGCATTACSSTTPASRRCSSSGARGVSRGRPGSRWSARSRRQG
jgi:uncharacterized protein (DUF488 family)